MTINGIKETLTVERKSVRAQGLEIYAPAKELHADLTGTLAAGRILAEAGDGTLYPYGEVAGEVVGTGEAAATAVAAETLGAGDDTLAAFSGYLANPGVDPGTVEIDYTIGTATLVGSDDGLGLISGDSLVGSVDYHTGHYDLAFSDAPDNGSNVTADYSHTPPAAAFNATLADAPIQPGSLVVTDGEETFSDDGEGNLTGDAGGSGSISYTTGALSVTFAVAPLESEDVTATYRRKAAGVLDVDTDLSDADAATVIRKGTVSLKDLTMGVDSATAVDDTAVADLETIGIYAL